MSYIILLFIKVGLSCRYWWSTLKFWLQSMGPWGISRDIEYPQEIRHICDERSISSFCGRQTPDNGWPRPTICNIKTLVQFPLPRMSPECDKQVQCLFTHTDCQRREVNELWMGDCLRLNVMFYCPYLVLKKMYKKCQWEWQWGESICGKW